MNGAIGVPRSVWGFVTINVETGAEMSYSKDDDHSVHTSGNAEGQV